MGYKWKFNNGPSKDLLFQIAGNYENSTFDVLTPVQNEYIQTDYNGEISFPKLQFSTWGEAGSYTLRYTCDGYYAASTFETVVVSWIKKISLAADQVKWLELTHPAFAQFHLTYIVEVLDKDNNGVYGKFPSSVTVESMSVADGKIKVQIISNITQYKFSSPDGIMSVPLRIACLSEPMKVWFRIVVDHLTLITPEILLIEQGDFDSRLPTYIQVPQDLPETVKLSEALGERFNFHIYNSYCNFVEEEAGYGELMIDFDLDGFSPLPRDFYLV